MGKWVFELLTISILLTGCAWKGVEIAPNTPETARAFLLQVDTYGTTLGNPSAPTKVAVFHDVNCGMCRKMWREVVKEALGDEIASGRVAFRLLEFPLGLAPNSSAISIVGKCAAEQGRYREFMEVVYSTKGEHGEGQLTEFAERAGLSIPQVNKCLDSGRGKAAAKIDVTAGEALGVIGTPTFFINGKELKENWTAPGAWDRLVNRFE